MSRLPSISTVLWFFAATWRLRRTLLLLPLITLGLALPSLRAATFGDFQYTNAGSAITITKYTGSGGAVTIPSTINGKPVTSIGYGAFSNCTGLTNVTIPDSVAYIANSAFYGCPKLADVVIPTSVTFIGDNAFYRCAVLTSVTIPASVSSIGASAFAVCARLVSIDVAPANPAYISVNGVLFTKTLASLLSYPTGRLQTSYSIPSGVISIEDYAFSECSILTNVTIPHGVTSIGNFAFSFCPKLTSTSVPGGVTFIGKFAFFNCPKLSNLTIPDSVASIGNSAFQYCSALTSLTIPASVTSIGDGAFCSCDRLTSINVDPANSAYASLDGVLFTKTLATLLQYPPDKFQTSYTIPDSVSSIGDQAFKDCSRLTSVTIPSSVASIGQGGFAYCPWLTSVTIPNSVTSIGEFAFFACERLTVVTMPASVTSIGTSAFANCDELASAIFLGKAPNVFGDSVFAQTAGSFRISYLKGATGFTSPSWKGYNTSILPSSFSQWVGFFGLGAENRAADANPSGDGLPNLVKYALDLDPTLPAIDGQPVLVSEDGQIVYRVTLSLLTTGITSTIQTSADLVNWDDALTTIESSTATTVTASVTLPTGTPRRFARLAVTQP
ncbi:MAG: leucine-rich repeat domain-containing protein [Opitutaceae bacterium]|nr:leucine-rich repeat domain-containing protein [Opitutaceae bacterium]